METRSGNPITADKSASQTASTVKQFTLGQVLSITNGRLLCEMGEVYEILNHITGDSLFTHQLPRASRFAKPLLMEAFPALEIANTESINEDLTRRLDEAQKIGGNPMGAIGGWLSMLNLPMLLNIDSHSDSWLSLNPMEEFAGMLGSKAKIVSVSMDESPEEIAEKIKNHLA